MLFFRLVFGLLLVASLLCFAIALVTGQTAWQRRGVRLLKWTIFAAGGFFAVLILERLAQWL